MKIGLGFSGFRVHSLSAMNELVDLCVLAEECGFDSAWIPENFYTNDAVVTAASVAFRTKTLKIGTGILSPIIRNSVLVAMTFVSLDEISNGRAMMGIGKTPKVVITDQLGIPVASPLQFFRESIQVLNDLVAGKEVNMDGRYHKLKGIRLESKPPRPHIPLFLGAVGPKMLQLAGELADGVVLGDISSPDYVRWAAKIVRDEAKRVGRNPDDIEIGGYVLTSMGEDAMEEAKRTIAYFVPRREQPIEITQLRTGASIDVINKVTDAVKRRNINEAMSYIPDDTAKFCTASGTKDEILDKIRQYYDAGMTLPMICPATKNSREIVKMLGSSL